MKSMKFRIGFYAFLNCWNQFASSVSKSVPFFFLPSYRLFSFFFNHNAVDVPLKFSLFFSLPPPRNGSLEKISKITINVRGTHRCNFAIDDRVIGAARVTRGKIRFTIGTANRAELVPIAVACSLAGLLEPGQSRKIYRCRSSFSFFPLSFEIYPLSGKKRDWLEIFNEKFTRWICRRETLTRRNGKLDQRNRP